MATVSNEAYKRLTENRPYKFDEEEVNYRDAESSKDKCGTCAHFFARVIDKFHTCEIFRPSDDSEVISDYVCDFWTDGKAEK